MYAKAAWSSAACGYTYLAKSFYAFVRQNGVTLAARIIFIITKSIQWNAVKFVVVTPIIRILS